MLLPEGRVSFLLTLNQKLDIFMPMEFIIINCFKNVNINNFIA